GGGLGGGGGGGVLEGEAGVVGRGQGGVVQREQFEADRREDRPHLDHLARIRRRHEQLHFLNASSSAASCFWCNSRSPFCASPIIAVSCSGVNGRFSAVPWTSSSSP